MTKLILSFCLLLALLPAAHAQMGLNAPAGLAPVRDMEIYSRDQFVVQQKYSPTTDPISGTFTMSCAASPPSITASAGVLLDPNGTNNYLASLTCTQLITAPGNPATTPGISLVGYELTFTQFGTEANGDSVVIEGLYDGRIAYSGSVLPPVLLVPGYRFTITFKADNDGNVGTGFALHWRRVNLDPAPTGVGDGQFGKSLQFDLIKGALVGGLNGVGTLQRAGNYSTALGRRNRATGYAAIALGEQNTVSGDMALAMGGQNRVSGDYAVATGYLNTASGNYSTAMGHRMNTNNQAGAFMIGDTDPLGGGTTNGGSPDQFVARFRNGY